MVENSENNRRFRQGTAETTGLDGRYKGSAPVMGSWVGKKIINNGTQGINVFEENGTTSEQYPFAVSVTKGLRDRQMDIIRLEYNQPENPWWLRLITDEMVVVGPNIYLGKVHVRVIPGIPFTAGFFTLEK